ncbi:WRKY domain-containing protein [Cephalotus follicularis]|uniref:WRKY domain-containing protein n=1 Tax=Cephalotus follicularis TaxID=3775 RepID=A0A1Q3C3C4_CEPFO|nr:WRKY domain-containing protein [Cephalotus follicularis]
MHMVSSGKGVSDEVASDLRERQSPSNKGHVLEQIPDTRIHAAHADKGGSTPSIIPKREPRELDTGVHSLQSDQQGCISSLTSEKSLLTPCTVVHTSQCGQERSTPPIVREKVLEDGYHWRKYGQKNVKGNEYIRSYYRCTHPNCQVKKQLERSHDGQITDTIYFGQHDHAKPPCNPPLAAGLIVSIVGEKPDEASVIVAEDKSTNTVYEGPHPIEPTDASPLTTIAASDDVKVAYAQSYRIRDEVENDDFPSSKRQKKDVSMLDVISNDKPSHEPRIVVQTISEVDIVNDGYRWRKYGQKLVKGNPNPRSYYRCSNPGCPVKKHVERASYDLKVVITTYEGQHDHSTPPTRTVTLNANNLNNSTTQNGESGSISLDSDGACLSMVVHTGSGPDNKPFKQLNAESISTSGGHDASASDMVVQCSSDRKSIELQNGKSCTAEESDDVGLDKVQASSVDQTSN